MGEKSIYDVIYKGGEIHPPRVKGTIEAWIDHKEDYNYKEDHGCIPVEVKRGLKSDASKDWFSFLNNKVSENLYEELSAEDERNTLGEIFDEYWDSNEELRERFKEISYWCHEASILINVKAAEDQGGIKKLLDKYGKQKLATLAYGGSQYIDGQTAEDMADDDEEHEDQSSFGASQFPQLYELGVVGDSGGVIEPKFKGLVLAFLRDVDEIRGESDEFEIKWGISAMLYWGKDKWGDEWIRFVAKYTSLGLLEESFSHIYTTNDEGADLCHTKYKGGCDIGVGKLDTYDPYQEFVDGEVDEPEEEDEEDVADGKRRLWQDYEEKNQRERHKWQDEDDDKQTEQTKDKWEQFAEEAGVKEGGSDEDQPEDTDADTADAGDDSDDGVGTDTTGSGGLNEWTEKYGAADPEDVRPKKNGQKKIDGGSGSSKTEVRKTSSRRRTKGGKTGTRKRVGREYQIQWPNVERMDEIKRNHIYEGNTFEWAMKLPKNSVDTIVTSPPYYALRDYDVEDTAPISGDFTCDHELDDNFCMKCGAFVGQLGSEPDPALFIDHIVDLMNRYREVLKPTGSLWLNIGDTYAGKNFSGRVNVKNKSRMMIPDRIYRRMVEEGWRLRDYVIWVKKIWTADDDLKGNGKPFASSSRLADQWEPLLRFSPTGDPYTDVDSNRLMPPSFDGDMGTEGSTGKFRDSVSQGGEVKHSEDTQRGRAYHPMGTNPPDVWHINSDGYQGDHRAVFPEELPKRCIKFSTPDKVCGRCGTPYEKTVHVNDENTVSPGGDYATYEQQCGCNAEDKPGIAFDPFLGSGTTGVAAANNGFDWAGTELSPKYAKLARERIPTGRQIGLSQF